MITMTTLLPKACPSLRYSLWVLVLCAALPVSAQRSGDGTPCEGPHWRALSSIVGEYTLERDGRQVGTTEFRDAAGGCALVRTATLDGQELTTLVFFDPADQQWHTVTVLGSSGVVRGKGTLQLNGSDFDSLNIDYVASMPDGSTAPGRATLEQGDDHLRETLTVQQQGEWVQLDQVVYSSPSGRGESRSRSRQTRRATPTETVTADETDTRSDASRNRESSTSRSTTRVTSAAPPAVEEAPAEPPSAIRVRSGKEGDSTASNTRVSKITVESPMLVELPLGPIDKLPDGYGWRSKDLAGYEVDGGTIEIVEVKRQKKRGKSNLLVTIFGRSEAFTAEYEITVHMVDPEGNRLSEDATTKLYTGRVVSSQINDGVSSATVELAISKADFDQAFAGDERPLLSIRVVALG